MSKSLTDGEGSEGSEGAPSSPGSQMSQPEEVAEIEDGSSDASSETDDAGGLLDVMAAEGEETDESDQDDDASTDDEPASFSLFSQLPPELRRRVWEIFCPELSRRSRIFEFAVSPGTARYDHLGLSAMVRHWTIRDWVTLGDQTKSIRQLLSVHQESRAIALQRFPDALSMDAGSGDAIVRFNKDKDVALINQLRGAEPEDMFHLTGFAENVKNGGIAGWERGHTFKPEALAHLLQPFSILESFFFCTSSRACRMDNLVWCTSDLVHRQFLEQPINEEELFLGDGQQFLYSWPDLCNHIDFARYQIPQDFLDPVPEPVAAVLRQKDAKSWPMVIFENLPGLMQYDALLAPGPGGYESNGSDETPSHSEAEESGTDLDQYESDGIDDDEIVEISDASDDEISLDGQSHEGVPIDGDGSEAQFSSPEPEPANRVRKRRVVEDSDDDSDDAEPASKRPRTTLVASSDSEDDGDEETEERAPVKRQSRVVLSDSESDDEEQMEGTKLTKSPGADENESSSGEDESDESESESDGDEQPAAPLSLAERLRMHREVNPIESSDGDGSDVEGSQEDDSEEDEGSEDEGQSRNPFFADMAEDEDEDEDDEEDNNEDNFYQLDD